MAEKIHCITHSLNLVTSNHHDLTLIRNSSTATDDIHNASKASNHPVHDQKRDCFQCKACISASQAGWRLTVSKPLCLSFLSLLRLSQSEKTDYHSSKVKVHFKQTRCEGRIFHHIHADHKIGDWLQHPTMQVPAANLEETSLSEDTADGSEWWHCYCVLYFLQHFQIHLAALIFHQLLWLILRETPCCNRALRL